MPKAVALKAGAVRQLDLTDSLEIPKAGSIVDPALTFDAGQAGIAASSGYIYLVIAGSLVADITPDGDLNVGRHLFAKNGRLESTALRLFNGANYIGLRAPLGATDFTWDWPAADGTAGQVLETDGSGGLSWGDKSSGGTLDHGALNGLADDDHAQYVLGAGRTGGQTIYGGLDPADDLQLRANPAPSSSGLVYFGNPSSLHYYGESAGELVMGGIRANAGSWSQDESLTVGFPSGPSLIQRGIYVNAAVPAGVNLFYGVQSTPVVADGVSLASVYGIQGHVTGAGTGSADRAVSIWAVGPSIGTSENWALYATGENYLADTTYIRNGLRLQRPSGGIINNYIEHVAATGSGAFTYTWPNPKTAGFVLTDTDGNGTLGWTDVTSLPGDNLGNHIATQNLQLGAFSLSNTGGGFGGLTFDTDNKAYFGENVTVQLGVTLKPFVGNALVTHTVSEGDDHVVTFFWPNHATGAGHILTDTDGNGTLGWTDPAGFGDNLGDHTATENIQTAGFWLSNDGLDAGILIDGSNYVTMQRLGVNTPALGNRVIRALPSAVNQFAFEMVGNDGAADTLSRGYFWNDAAGNISIWLDDLTNTNQVRLRSDTFSFFRQSLVVGGNITLGSTTTYPLQADTGLLIGGTTVPRLRIDTSGSDSRARNWEFSTNTYNWSDFYVLVSSSQGVAPDTRMFALDHEGRLGVGDGIQARDPIFFLDGHASVNPTGIVRGRLNNFGTVLRSTNEGSTDATWEIYVSGSNWHVWKYTTGDGGAGADVFRFTPYGVEISNGTLIVRRDAQPVVDFREGSGPSLGLFGMASSADDLITGSEPGDYGNRCTNGSVLFSTDAGVTLGAKLNKTNQRFELAGQIQIAGGSPAPGKVLLCDDANGLGVWQDLPDETLYQANLTADFTTGDTQIPLHNELGNDRGIWTLNAGDLEALKAVARANIKAKVLIQLDAGSNNVDVEVEITWIVTTTGGTSIAIPGVFPFQTSRAWSPRVTIETQLAVSSLAIGDKIRLVGRVAAGNTADANSAGGIVSVEAIEA